MNFLSQADVSDQFFQKTRKVSGFLVDDEAILLFNLARSSSKQGVIVEIGSWQGKSTAWLAFGAESCPVFAVDPHRGRLDGQKRGPSTLRSFKLNMKRLGLAQIVQPVVKTSLAASRKFKHPINLLFIDGDHRYEQVRADFVSWSPKVITGGTIAFHDTLTHSGVRKLVNEQVFLSPHYEVIGFVNSIVYAKKTMGLNRFRRIKNYYLLFLHEIVATLVFLKNYLPGGCINFGKKLSLKLQPK